MREKIVQILITPPGGILEWYRKGIIALTSEGNIYGWDAYTRRWKKWNDLPEELQPQKS